VTTVGQLLDVLLKETYLDREILVDIGDPPVSRKGAKLPSRNAHRVYGIDTETFKPLLLEL
jgi:hypothetical protein